MISQAYLINRLFRKRRWSSRMPSLLPKHWNQHKNKHAGLSSKVMLGLLLGSILSYAFGADWVPMAVVIIQILLVVGYACVIRVNYLAEQCGRLILSQNKIQNILLMAVRILWLLAFLVVFQYYQADNYLVALQHLMPEPIYWSGLARLNACCGLSLLSAWAGGWIWYYLNYHAREQRHFFNIMERGSFFFWTMVCGFYLAIIMVWSCWHLMTAISSSVQHACQSSWFTLGLLAYGAWQIKVIFGSWRKPAPLTRDTFYSSPFYALAFTIVVTLIYVLFPNHYFSQVIPVKAHLDIEMVPSPLIWWSIFLYTSLGMMPVTGYFVWRWFLTHQKQEYVLLGLAIGLIIFGWCGSGGTEVPLGQFSLVVFHGAKWAQEGKHLQWFITIMITMAAVTLLMWQAFCSQKVLLQSSRFRFVSPLLGQRFIDRHYAFIFFCSLMCCLLQARNLSLNMSVWQVVSIHGLMAVTALTLLSQGSFILHRRSK